MILAKTADCPGCKRVAQILKKAGMEFEEIDLGTAKGLSELRSMEIFELSAPVLVLKTEPVVYLDSRDLTDQGEEAILLAIRNNLRESIIN